MSLEDAKKLIGETEKTIQKMAASSMKQGAYDEAIKLISLAKSLSHALKEEETLPGSIKVSPKQEETKKANLKKSTPKGYPRFERDEKNLIMVSWHGTRNHEYLEKAPKELLDKLVKKCLAASPGGEPFSTGGDFPKIKDRKGNLFRRNQVTVCLAWLRAEGLLERKGFGANCRYRIPHPEGFMKEVEKKYNALPVR